MIIVEGSDHVGKTTLCNKLIEEMPGAYYHMSKPGPEFDYFGDYLKKLKKGCVYDRFHYGAYVYGAMLGLHPTYGYNADVLCRVSRFIRFNNGLIIVLYDSCAGPYEQRLYSSDRNEMFNPSNILAANQIFSQIHLVDEPDIMFDVKGGSEWPDFASDVVKEWRVKNGF